MYSPTAAAITIVGLAAWIGTACALGENRTYDGTDNHAADLGAAGTPLARLLPADYADGYAAPAGATRPSARQISNVAIAQTGLLPNTHAMTDWVFQWGQFVDHDIDLTALAVPAESFDIPIPLSDPIFDQAGTGTVVMEFQRSNYVSSSGTPGNPREQINDITSFLDGSMVYGSSASRALALRTMSGGQLKTSAGNLLPLNTEDMNLPNGAGGGDPSQFYVAGDVRANEQVGLTATHTLFMREHNRLAAKIAEENDGWSDEQIYQRARKLVGAEIQVITYNEFLPALLGPFAPGLDASYSEGVDPSIFTEFSTALFRVGHTMLPQQLMRMTNDGLEAPGGHMQLREAFFQPNNMAGENELDYLLKGLASDQQQEVDMHVVDEVRNFLFGEPLAGGFDLASLNIQRGRDHGLPDYNSVRQVLGLDPVETFADISSDIEIQTALQVLYGSVDDIDLWVGALAEDHAPGAAVGELIAVGLREQFTRLRDGDRFWYRNDEDLSAEDIAWLESTQLSDIIRRNTEITHLQANVFLMVPEPTAGIIFGIGTLAMSLIPKWRAKQYAA